MNEKKKKGEDERPFSLSTLSVEKPPLLLEYLSLPNMVFIFYIMAFSNVLRWYCSSRARKWCLIGAPTIKISFLPLKLTS